MDNNYFKLLISQNEFQTNFVNNFQTLYYQHYRKKNSWKEKIMLWNSCPFIHKPELRFHYRFLSIEHQTKKWSFENLPPCDLVYAFLSRSFRFFFWPVVWHLWRFNSALITPTCNSAAKQPALYRVWNNLQGMVWTSNFAVCHQVEGQEDVRSSCLRIKSKWSWQTISNGSSSSALRTWRLVCP